MELFKLNKKNIFYLVFLVLLSKGVKANSPSYVKVCSCKPAAIWVIDHIKISKKVIHKCTSKKNNDNSHIVSIDYGQAQDCPSGCFYDNITGVLDKQIFSTIPRYDPHGLLNNMLSKLPGINQIKHKCSPYDWKKAISLKVKKEGVNWGWHIKIKKPFTCTWFKIISTKIDMKNAHHNTGYKMKRIWTGHAFGYFLKKEIVWNIREIKTDTTQSKETTKIVPYK